MPWEFITLLGGILLGVLAAYVIFSRRNPASSLEEQIQRQFSEMHRSLADVQNRLTQNTGEELHRLNERLDQRLKETSELVAGAHNTMGERLDRNTELFGQVQKRMATLEESGKQIYEVGKTISELQDILQAPKLRGNLGELFLEELLAQVLAAPYYEMQYRFRSGEAVDAVIRLANGALVPIDAKFPLENFKRALLDSNGETEKKKYRKAFASDFKKHVDQISKKYILPDEGTLDFALMYIPAENVYYEAILRDPDFGDKGSINEYAIKKRVIPVSPNSFYAYLQAIALGLRGMQIEEKAQEILATLSRLQIELDKFSEEFQLVGRHLEHAAKSYDKSDKRLGKLQSRFSLLEEESEKKIPLPPPSDEN